jgi:NAD(P)-dependent dehydrogenase (short-subunit alcohol dehydrogenase family)
MSSPTSSQQIALVTGANRGIGFETCRQLANQGMHVLLTSRNSQLGEQAAASLSRLGHQVDFHPLDVTDGGSLDVLREFVMQQYGRLDVLVNNAGVYLDEGVSVFDVPMDVFRLTMETNFYGPLSLCRALVPLMVSHSYGRVVNVSSGYGSMNEIGGHVAAYRVSKIALNALTRILAAEVNPRQIKVNAVDPGWVRTRMGGSYATRSVEQGVETIVWLATLPPDGPTGGFFYDKKPIPW